MEQKTRSELRVQIMNILYQISIYKIKNITYNVDDVIKENIEIDNEFVKEIVYGVITNEKDIDEIANKYLNNWTIDRLGYTDQAIMRMAIYELEYTDTPKIVCAKSYSDDDVRKMINASLDKLYHDIENNESK